MQFARMVNSAKDTAFDKENVHFACFLGTDDPHLHSYSRHMANVITMVGRPWSAVMASNHLANRCLEIYPEKKLYIVGSDDTIFATPHWDKALIDAYEALENKVHVFSMLDSRDAKGTPHPIVTREYIDAMGYFLPPIFLHWFVDSWTVDIAKSNNCFMRLDDYLLVHDKPSDRGESDETHMRIRNLGWHERDTYVNQSCRHFLELEKKRLAQIIGHQKGIYEHAD